MQGNSQSAFKSQSNFELDFPAYCSEKMNLKDELKSK